MQIPPSACTWPIRPLERSSAVRLFERIFRGRISDLLLNFIGVANEHGRLKLLPQMIGAYEELLQVQLGKVEVDVYVARILPADELEAVRKRVSAALKKDAVVHQYVDDSIIGGMILRVGDKLIDATPARSSARSNTSCCRRKYRKFDLA